jgi:16S rRNA (guanine527-N7)-methyltransferase
MIEDEAQVRAWLADLPQCDTLAMERLEQLVRLLREENQRQNLVSRASLGEVWRRHVADSAQLLLHVPRETKGTWLDLGTGAGFPGLVIAILLPHLPVRMIESRSRRVDWLEGAIRELGLKHADVYPGRLETLPDCRAAFISARAFAPLDKLLDLSARFSTSDTLWLLPKGMSAQQELDDLVGWKHAFHVERSLTDAQAGVIVGTLAGRKARKS